MILRNIFIIFSILTYSECARILATVYSPSFSHQIAFRPLWKALADRGHEIVLLTTDPMPEKIKNIHQIDLSKSYEIMESSNASKILSDRSSQNKSGIQLLMSYIDAMDRTADWQFSQTEVKQLIQNKNEHFDLLILEVMFPAHAAFVDRFKAPFIGITSLDAPPRIHENLGNPTSPVLYPDYALPLIPPLTFLERLISTIFSWAMTAFNHYYIFPLVDGTVKKHFGDGIRPVNEIHNDMDLLFVNINPIFHYGRPLGPNTIQIGGGTHIKKSKKLPNEIKLFLDEAKKGVIYFSLGTNVKSSLLNEKLKSTILKTFELLPYKILWKFENDNLPGKPKNVKILKWIPQEDVLRHPNVKLFITQCGLQSMEEAIFSGIPMVGMPFFNDQLGNARILENKGFGIKIDRLNLTVDIFKNAILKVMNNPIYRENEIKIANLIKDVEMSGLEKAVWWTEYTIRHKGAKHFRNPGVNVPFYQYYLLDVIAFVMALVFVPIYILFKICKCICKNRKQKTE